MPELDDGVAEPVAEKAYAAAAEAVAEKTQTPAPVVTKKATPVRKARKAVASKSIPEPAPAIQRRSRKSPTTAQPAVKRVVTRKPRKPSAASAPTMKDQIMSKSSKFTDGIKSAVSDAQDKAKVAYAKGTEMLGEYTEFTKGNVEAVVESGKILATGLKELGGSLVEEGKAAFETITADVKELTAIKSPADAISSASVRVPFVALRKSPSRASDVVPIDADNLSNLSAAYSRAAPSLPVSIAALKVPEKTCTACFARSILAAASMKVLFMPLTCDLESSSPDFSLLLSAPISQNREPIFLPMSFYYAPFCVRSAVLNRKPLSQAVKR